MKIRGLFKFRKGTVITVIAIFATALTVYFFKPNKEVNTIYQLDLKDRKLFNCSVKMGAGISPKEDYTNNPFKKVEGNLFKDDGTKMSIEIDGKILKMLTSTSLGPSGTSPFEMNIVSEDESRLVAVDPDTSLPQSNDIDTFVLKKKSGSAVWTKAIPTFPGTEMPITEAYYMECR